MGSFRTSVQVILTRAVPLPPQDATGHRAAGELTPWRPRRVRVTMGQTEVTLTDPEHVLELRARALPPASLHRPTRIDPSRAGASSWWRETCGAVRPAGFTDLEGL